MPNWFKVGLIAGLLSLIGLCSADEICRANQTPKRIEKARVASVTSYRPSNDLHLGRNTREVRVMQHSNPILFYSPEADGIRPGDLVDVSYTTGLFGRNVGSRLSLNNN